MCPIITAAWMYTDWCNSGVMHHRSYQWPEATNLLCETSEAYR